MLRLRDALTGELAQVLPAGRRQLRILVLDPTDGEGAGGLAQLRAYLTADLLRRAAEVSRLLPLVSDLLPDAPGLAGPEGPAGTAAEAELRAACDALGIHPPRETFRGPASALAGTPPFDVGVGVGFGTGMVTGTGQAAGASAPEAGESTGWARLRISVAGLAAAPGEAPAISPRDVLGRGAEPGAVRLRLLRHGYGDPVADGGEAGGDAADTLKRWRSLVAHWARSPSGAMSRRHTDAVRDAFADNLDTAAALRVLDDLTDDPDVPDGVKFETFAAADRLLGLDLARDIGK